jgi:hypothetical protein
MPIQATAPKVLTHSDAGVVLAASATSRVCAVATYTVPRGVGMIFKGLFRFRFKIWSANNVEMPVTTLFRFAYRPSNETVWTQAIGSPIPYEAWESLSLGQQKNSEYAEALMVNLGIDWLALTPGEQFLIEVYDTGAAVNATYTKFFLEYAELTPEAAAGFVARRIARFGR